MFISPMARLLQPGGDGAIHGKDALREYGQEGHHRIPNLHLDAIDT